MTERLRYRVEWFWLPVEGDAISYVNSGKFQVKTEAEQQIWQRTYAQ